MPLDPSIYSNVGRINLGQGLSDILNQQREREAVAEQRQLTLASLAQQQQAAQEQRQALQQQQAQKRSQELNMWLSGAVQSGRPIEQVLPEAIAKGREINVPDEVTQRHVTSVYAQTTPQARSDIAFTQAYPELVAKQRAESMFAKEKTAQLSQGQRGQIIFDNQGNAYNVNPYTNEVQPVTIGGKQIQGAQFAPGLQGQISGARALGSETGKATGEAVVSLKDIESQMPNLEKLVTDLSAIGKKATYTKTGQIADIARRQLGMDVGEGAVARKEYISKVDNEILPLLRQTFGAAFTAKEGESLRATLGDPDASPEEKDAVLRSFIQTKKAQVESLKRRTGEPTTAPAGSYDADKEARYQAWKAQQGR